MTAFAFSEKRLCDVIGISRKEVKEVRKNRLEKEAAYQAKGNRILYSENGVRALLEALKLKIPEKRPKAPDGVTMERLLMMSVLPSLAPEDIPIQGPTRALLVIVDVPKNRGKILFARFKDVNLAKDFPMFQNDTVSVRVRDNTNFVTGVEINCVHAQGVTWDFVGRCPTSKRQATLMGRRSG